MTFQEILELPEFKAANNRLIARFMAFHGFAEAARTGAPITMDELATVLAGLKQDADLTMKAMLNSIADTGAEFYPE